MERNGAGAEFRLSDTQSHLVPGHVPGEAYRVDLAIPAGPAPSEGWPAIYLLDASGCFATCVEALRRMSRRPDATGVGPAVVVGLSPPDGGYDVPRRQRDFTTPRPDAPDDGGATGGAPAFLDFIIQTVKPFVAARAALAPDRGTLFGHSLAGYFALWVLGHRPDAFRNYAAVSPSVWWDKAGLFAAASQLDGGDRRALVAVGAWEDTLPPWQRAAPGSAEVAARRGARGMVENARAMSDRLAAALGPERVTFTLLADEDHASIVSAAIPRALRLACRA